MATIALSGNTLGCSLGMGSFTEIGTAFSNAKQSAGYLANALDTLKSKLDLASVGTRVDESQNQVQKAQKREKEKESALTIAYEKLDALITDVGMIDTQVADKIRQRKDNFYNQYCYLKPECEKSIIEKYDEWRQSVWEGLCDIGEAIAGLAVALVEWCKEHWVELLTTIAVIAAALVAAVFLGPAAVAAICGLISFICMAADIIAETVTGKDVYTLLKESGHSILAEIFAGVALGTAISGIALNFTQLFTQIHKVGLSNFMKTLSGGEGIRGIVKTLWGGIKSDFTAVFGKGRTFGQRVKAIWNIVVLNQDGEFSFKGSINAYRHGGEKIITAVNTVGFDENNNLVAKSNYAKEALTSRGYSKELIATKKSSFLFDQSVDYDWSYYGAKKVAEVDVMDMYKKGKVVYKPDGTVDADELRAAIWKEAGVQLPKGQSRHELYEIKKGKVSVLSVDQVIHSKKVFGHNGGVSHAARIINEINSGVFAHLEKKIAIESLPRTVPDFLWDFGNQFYSWAYSREGE